MLRVAGHFLAGQPYLASSLYFLSSTVVQALVLNTPSASNGFNALITNGTATVSWTSQPSDPDTFSIILQNFVTLDTFNFALNVSTSAGSVGGILDGVPGSPHYYLQASRIGNFFDVIANSSTFTVDGIVPSTTDSSLVPSTSFFASTSPSSPLTFPSPSTRHASSSSASVGAIIGGTIGGLIFIAFIVLAIFFLRNRKQKRHFLDPDDHYAKGSGLSPSSSESFFYPILHRDPQRRHNTSLESPSTVPVPYPLTIPTSYPNQTPTKLERYAQGQREKEQRLEQLKSWKAKMMEQRDKLRSEVIPNSSDGVGSEMGTGAGVGLGNGTEVGLSQENSTLGSGRSVNETESHLVGTEDGSLTIPSSRQAPVAPPEPRLLDPEVQRRLDEMSQRIEELEIEKLELTRELQDSVPPPGYVE